jgi:hypothetical protein
MGITATTIQKWNASPWSDNTVKLGSKATNSGKLRQWITHNVDKLIAILSVEMGNAFILFTLLI